MSIDIVMKYAEELNELNKKTILESKEIRRIEELKKIIVDSVLELVKNSLDI